ncbi:LOW QUALITY PROTEIN: olfactory receptor 24-like [Vombatus ursinus]|uniref:LOW QUALITY PROTEIN: olfactory receptor 24-like n=1 Tax=Vombatus ursinus TaxID=29139 RepID=UPI000FFCF2D5|nr:LOW QUALITY PROTEIN: olfactory receptor 24-like [Vombatus ursinus]XP_027723835.1 LOW QUALITY PROTEIN: olfactory receptor 24-like [Vombatus ursinus]
MDKGNQTGVSEFFLLGISERPEQQLIFFGLFLGMYLVTLVGNLTIILAIIFDAHLHIPMYFFVANLSFVDLSFPSTMVPKILVDTKSGNKKISYGGCLTQLYFFGLLAHLDNFLLAVMAYDRYMAISCPLSYATAMSPQHCILTVAVSWVVTVIHALLHILLLDRLVFCGPNTIPHFYCDLIPLLKLACSDTHINELMLFLVSGTLLVGPFLCILVSCIYILLAILKIHSQQGKHKAFSNCTSHLSMVSLFYASAIGVYLCPSSISSTWKERAFAAMYMVVTPMLNPFIYSLRIKDMKRAIRKLYNKGTLFFWELTLTLRTQTSQHSKQ